MKIIETSIPDVKIIEPRVFGDERGFFMETWNERMFRQAGIEATFVQDNQSRSVRNTLRGLHYQLKQPQGKVVRVTHGEVFDVAVDLRKASPTFGQSVAAILSADNKRQMWVPEGFAHGFLVLSDSADFLYKTTDYYHPESEQTLLWCDPTLKIDWPLDVSSRGPLLSDKDKAGKKLEFAPLF